MKTNQPSYLAFLLAVLALALIAPINFKLGPVPITLQTLVVLTIAGLLTPRWSWLPISVYLLLGAFGLPVFGAHTAGWEKLVGPTAGFLWSFLPASVLFSMLSAAQGRSYYFLLLAAFGAHLLILLVGFTVLHLQWPQVDIYATFVRLLPALLIKTFLVALLVKWGKEKLPPMAGVLQH